MHTIFDKIRYFTNLLFGVYTREDVIIARPLHQLPGGEVKLADERVIAASIVVETLNTDIPVLQK